MSGGPKGAKRPLERPLDGGVRCLRQVHGAFWQPERAGATRAGVRAGASTTAQTPALRYAAGPQAALNIELVHGADRLDVRGGLLPVVHGFPYE